MSPAVAARLDEHDLPNNSSVWQIPLLSNMMYCPTRKLGIYEREYRRALPMGPHSVFPNSIFHSAIHQHSRVGDMPTKHGTLN